MPMYDFKSTCGQRFEALVKHGDLPKCPCGSTDCATERQLSAPGSLVFKGDGFYKPGASVR